MSLGDLIPAVAFTLCVIFFGKQREFVEGLYVKYGFRKGYGYWDNKEFLALLSDEDQKLLVSKRRKMWLNVLYTFLFTLILIILYQFI